MKRLTSHETNPRDPAPAPEKGPQGAKKRRKWSSKRRLTAPFPFVDCPAPQLLSDPEATWEKLLSDLDSARQRILLENYILRDSVAGHAVSDRLILAAERGVKVAVHIDGIGSLLAGSEAKQRLKAAGIALKIFNDPVEISSVFLRGIQRIIHRTHRRIIVVDDRAAWVGGIGISDPWWPGLAQTAARETMLRVTGALVQQAADAFDHLWHRPVRAMPVARILEARPGQARMVTQHPLWALRFRSVLYSRMKASQSKIWLATPYFIPSNRLRRVLRHASKSGIDVRLLLPGPLDHDHPTVRMAARRHYQHLLEAGIRIFEYQPAFFHSKIALFDDQWVVVGSANLDRISFFTNHELFVEARHDALAATTRKRFENDFAKSHEILLEDWNQRPLYERLFERFSGLFERFF